MANATTLRKRIAAVAVAALGLGVLNSGPASAAAPTEPSGITSVSSSSVEYLTSYTAKTYTVTTAMSGDLATNNEWTVTVTGEKSTDDGATWSADSTFLGKLSFTESAALAAANTDANADVTVAGDTKSYTVSPLSAAYSNGTGKATLNLGIGLGAGLYRAVLTTSETGAGTPSFNAPVYLVVSIGEFLNSSTTASPGSATVGVGGTTTFTVTDTFTAIGGATSSRTIAAGSTSGLQISVAPSATGGAAILATPANDYSNTVNYKKDSVEGAFVATLVVTVYVKPGTSLGTKTISYGGLTTFKLTVAAAGFAYSTVQVAGVGNGFYAEVEDAIYAPKTFSASAIATATVTQRDAAGTKIDDVYAKTVTATITGVGSLSPVTVTGGAGSAQLLTYLAGTDAARVISVYGDGRSGTGKVTIAVDGVVLKSFTVKFYGAAASIEVAPIYSIGEASATGETMGAIDTNATACSATPFATYTGTIDNDPAVAVYVKDANGFAIPAWQAGTGTLTASSSDVTVVKSVNFGFMDGDCSKLYSAGAFALHYTYTTAAGVASGKSSSLTWKFVNPDGTSVTSTPITVKTGGAVAKVVLTLDKASYAPGEKAVLTVTATDASGNAVYDNQKVTGALVSNLAVGSALPTASTYTLGGKYEYKIFAPSVAGEWTISGKDALGTAISVTAKVVADTTAIDAAKAAADAAKAEAAKATAAVAALSATVTSIQTAIAALVASTTATLTALTAKINKIMKKFKIK